MDKQTENEIVFEKFSQIIDEISQYYIKRGTLYLIFKVCKQTKLLLIHLKYKKETELNPFSIDVIFTLIIKENYPADPPEIYSKSNFSYPTLFDQRNLLFSILGHNWVRSTDLTFQPLNSRKNIDQLEELIQEIPKFLIKMLENRNNKVLIYFGSYKIDKEYDINDFLVNQKMLLYRVHHYSNKTAFKRTLKYLIVTDVNILLFSIPNDQQRNYAKLQFWGDLKQMANLKKRELTLESNDKVEIVKIEWQNGKKKVSFKLGFVDKSRNQFINIIKEKNERLKETFTLFIDDLAQPVVYEDIIMNQGKAEATAETKALLVQVEFYEKLFEGNKNLHAGKQLIVLYQKIIEIYSLNNSNNFQPYLLKLKRILEDPLIKDELKKESPTECRNLFDEKM